ncbi:DNA polymerase III subunit delta [Avibacterium paragallinarum]|uniref:DNA polymerase III subunit delta n=1 Tax=Avibacterium paragallinarum TaxID=728 RepID=A0A0F5F1F1_AVIPA|nr:DNA polymerase III subunit delta [Avibacterium paragallinarum]KAA6209837.1 DNA polymerase III subunit delta [Avibacterium paragallinarum]KKB02581.1 DNA polymerase III subunit delta [Avibacterium paragallinarum]RZN73406.1 DNA polymerase III subunit delta [Avibacterium paragallinarum]SUU98211.1 DNA polymerase III subunit delta [Avibacterium paragallinarum]
MQRLFAEQLAGSLTARLATIYYLVGQDPLLLLESKDHIWAAAKAQGFDEKNEITIENSTDWTALFEQVQSMGLFFNRQILLLNLPENLTALLQKQLSELVALLHPDILLVLQSPKLTKAMEKQAWFMQANQLEPQLCIVNCQTPNIDQLPRWITARAKSLDMFIEPDAVQLLCYSYENNLLALKQTLQLLALLYPKEKITLAKVQNVVEQSSVFTVFQWIDALLEGKSQRARRILDGLRGEDIQPVILLRTLQRELITILTLTASQQQINIDSPLSTARLREQFDQLKIWQTRRTLFTQAIQRLTYRKLYQIIQQLAELERLVKQEFSDEVWGKLADLSVKICH